MKCRFFPRLVLPLIGLALLAGCGGGGGGGGEDFIGAAQLELNISPHRIDTGDRTEVNIRISRIHPTGIALKIRYPKGLQYVPSSSVLEVDESDQDISPTVNQEKASDVYLVYYISEEMVGKDSTATLLFELEGKDDVKEGAVEVDADVDDPDVDNASEFNVETPEFGAEHEASIEVVD